MSRQTRAKRQFTTGEKWLFLSPLLLFFAVGLFLTIKRANSPRLIASELPVNRVVWLGDNKIFTLQGKEIIGDLLTFPVSVIYDIRTGEKLAERAWSTDLYGSQISPDGRFWLAREISDKLVATFVLRDLRDFSVVATMPAIGVTPEYEQYGWVGNRHILRLITHSATKKQSLWYIDEKSGSIRKLREIDKDSRMHPTSPDGKWVVKSVRGQTVSRPVITYNIKTGFVGGTNKTQIVSFPDERNSTKWLDYDSSEWAWNTDGKSLWSVSHLKGSILRSDFLKYDLKTHKTIATRLKDIDKTFPSSDLSASRNKFSPDCRLWCANNGQKWAFWDTRTGELVKTIDIIRKKGDEAYTDYTSRRPHFSDDSRYFILPTRQGVEIYDLSRFLS